MKSDSAVVATPQQVVGQPLDLRESAERIRSLWNTGVQDYVKIGRELKEAKRLHPKKFTAWVKDELPFAPRIAEYLIAIGKHPVISDPKHASVFPARWTTLAALAEVPEADLLKAMESGRVTPKLQRKQVAKLFSEPKKEDEEAEPRHAREVAEGILRSYLAATAKLTKVDVRHIDPARVAAWASTVVRTLKAVDDFHDKLRDLAPEEPAEVSRASVREHSRTPAPEATA